jgi:Pin2-interacting protein X1
MSSKSAAHISEILGIAPTTPSSHLLEKSQVKLTSLTNEFEVEKITTSTKSVADYFKEKLNSRSFSSTIVSSTRDSDDSYDTPRMGLGSRARLEDLTAFGEVERETQRMGLSTFPAFSSSLAFEKTLKDEGSVTTQMDANLDSHTKDLMKQKRKKTKTKDKEIEKGDGAGENDETKEREERRRKRKLDKAKNDPQLEGDLKKQERRERKSEKLLVSVTSPCTDTLVDEEKPQKERKERKKGSKPR